MNFFNMGFKFGLVSNINSEKTLICFLGVILFVIMFDFLANLLEFFVAGSELYNRMIQMIYKELMLMGLVSFTVIMINASKPAYGADGYPDPWIVGKIFCFSYT